MAQENTGGYYKDQKIEAMLLRERGSGHRGGRGVETKEKRVALGKLNCFAPPVRFASIPNHLVLTQWLF